MSQSRISGIGHMLRELMRAAQSDSQFAGRYRTRLLVPWDGAARVRSLQLSGTEIVRLPLPTRGFDRWPSLHGLPPLDALTGPGVYFFPHYGNWPLRRSRSITMFHDIAFVRQPATVGGNLGLLTRNACRWLGRTDLVGTVSHFSMSEMERYLGVDPARIVVIPNGVDPGVFRPRPRDEVERVRARYGLPEGYVLHLGNLEPRKNLVRLVRAHASLPPPLRDAHPLLLAGGLGWKQRELEAALAAAAAAGDRVARPAAYVEDDDLPALVSGAVALAHPSLYEGFGIAPLQAMACGVPVLVADNSAQPEVAGEAAVYVDAQSERSISSGLEALLTDSGLRRRLLTLGRARVQEFTWARSAAALRQALDRLAA